MRKRGLLLCAVPVAVVAASFTAVLFITPASNPPQTPRKLKGFFVLAREAFDRGDFAACEKHLEAHLEKNSPRDPGALFLLARTMKATQRHSESSDLFLALVSSNSLDEGQWGIAFRELETLAAADPKNPVPLKALAISLHRSGDASGTLSAAHKALALQPADEELNILMSQAAEEAAASVAPVSRPLGHFPGPGIPPQPGRRVKRYE